MDRKELTSKVGKLLNQTYSDNDNEALSSLRIAQKHLRDHADATIVSFYDQGSRLVDDEHGLSLLEWKEIAEDYIEVIDRLEADTLQLKRDLQKAKAEADRLRRETRLIEKQAPAAIRILGYKEKLKQWCQKCVVVDEESWKGTKEIQAEFEAKYPGMKKFEITLNRFSRFFHEITGEFSFPGGPKGNNNGFAVRLK